MSEYAKNIQTIEDMWKKRIGLKSEGGGVMPSHHIPAPFGYKTYAFLSECATCGKPYISFDRRAGWRTVFTCDEKTRTGMWLLYCPDCFRELEEVGE